MKKLISTLATVSVLAVSGHASAQTINVGSGAWLSANLELKQTLSSFIPCNFIAPLVPTLTGVRTDFPAPETLCYYGPFPIEATSEYKIVPVPGDYTVVKIKNITANALNGTCGLGEVIARVTNAGAPLELTIDEQSIPGVDSSNNNAPCFIRGTVIAYNVSLT